jgi:hypothetical protein
MSPNTEVNSDVAQPAADGSGGQQPLQHAPGNGGARRRLDEGFGWIPADKNYKWTACERCVSSQLDESLVHFVER